VWALAQSRVDGHHSLVTPETVLIKYNEDLIFDFEYLVEINKQKLEMPNNLIKIFPIILVLHCSTVHAVL